MTQLVVEFRRGDWKGELIRWEGPFEFAYVDEHGDIHIREGCRQRLTPPREIQKSRDGARYVVPYDPEVHQKTVDVVVRLTIEEATARAERGQDVYTTGSHFRNATVKLNEACKKVLGR